jgi:prepilin-type processing-associated H-X9-DG protein/prepilin-type N-terminal cleavage/methylation domain-containing protein
MGVRASAAYAGYASVKAVKTARAFTLVELLVVLCVVAILTTLSLTGVGKMRARAQQAHCANSLRQLGAATGMYLAENDQRLFVYSQYVPEGRLWYFGLETGGGGEGSRRLDETQAPLYPYLKQAGGVEVCPSFPYESALWKPKFEKASWGYGFNTSLSGVNVLTVERPQRILLFGDCAQVNTFQAPASAKKPMLEEFYMIDPSSKTIHFRHGAAANILFLDGHVEAMKMHPGTRDTRLKEANVGRITPVGSTEYLR